MNREDKLKLMDKQMEALVDISDVISSSLRLQEVAQGVLDTLHKKLGMERGTVSLVLPETNELAIHVACGLDLDEMKRGRYQIGEGVTGKVVATGEPIVVPNVGKEPLFLNRTRARGDLTKENVAFICVPIKVEDKTIGALSVDRLFQNQVEFEEDVRFLLIVSSYLAQAVKIHKLVNREKETLLSENRDLKQELKKRYQPVNIIGNSKRMIDVYSNIDLVASTRATVLIRGESGTGKELVAHAIHYHSDRADKPFVKVSCAALPETLLESEIFGYEKGAFTGATGMKRGKFEMAHTGTLFLDEIGDISPATQVKLLRVLQEKEFERVGGVATIRIDLRIIAATNKDLEREVREGRFREDLYYRLNVVPVFMPALRERKEDLPQLVHHFIEKSNHANRKRVERLSEEAWEYVSNYSWPGNIRELENAVERAVIMSQGEVIGREHFPSGLQANFRPLAELEEETGRIPDMSEAVENLERRLISEALEKTGGNKRKAARLLGVTERILGYKAKQYRVG